MEEKISVHCKTKEEFRSVCKKHGFDISCDRDLSDEPVGICIGGRWKGMYGACSQHREDEGYTIITAEEYLKKGEEFKVGDKVIAVNKGRNFDTDGVIVGNEYTIICIPRDSKKIDLGEMFSFVHEKNDFRLATNQTKTIKSEEAKMEINENVLDVFEGKPKDIKLVTKHFDSAMKERIFLEANKVAILKACRDAEKEAEDK